MDSRWNSKRINPLMMFKIIICNSKSNNVFYSRICSYLMILEDFTLLHLVCISIFKTKCKIGKSNSFCNQLFVFHIYFLIQLQSTSTVRRQLLSFLKLLIETQINQNNNWVLVPY